MRKTVVIEGTKVKASNDVVYLSKEANEVKVNITGSSNGLQMDYDIYMEENLLNYPMNKLGKYVRLGNTTEFIHTKVMLIVVNKLRKDKGLFELDNLNEYGDVVTHHHDHETYHNRRKNLKLLTRSNHSWLESMLRYTNRYTVTYRCVKDKIGLFEAVLVDKLTGKIIRQHEDNQETVFQVINEK